MGASLGSIAGASPSGNGTSQARAEDPFSRGEVRELTLAGTPGTRIEHFRLDLDPTPENGLDGGSAVRGIPVGLVRWIRGPLPGVGGGWRSSCEVLFHTERTRVLHTERLTAESRELVYREISARPGINGRTVYLAWTPDGNAVSTETGGGESRRYEHDLRGGGGLPLSLVDLARRSQTWTGDLRVFRPLSNAVERWRASLDRTDNGSLLRLTESGGREVGTYRFEEDRLVWFRWQAGGPVATAIPADEYERWEKAMPIDPPVLALAARTR